ncbi:MAG: 4Fe-4S binding protein [Spirochaetaceae bacterium]|nr:4Fe-4S binding protein [Spirochaetaceae bacterium]
MNGKSDFHSVELRDENCKGCTICVTSCPVEAIRVHGGKAHILETQCIDCGECIRKCPSRAKYALTASNDELLAYKTKVALLAPAFFAQFSEKTSRQAIMDAVKTLGFDFVYDISGAAGEVSRATAEFIRENKQTGQYETPIISSSCPAILKLIQIRFPSLIDHILPIIPPSENAARQARAQHPDAGIFFISPCPAKVTVARSPLGYAKSEIDGVFAMNAVYLPVLQALKKGSSAAGSGQAPSSAQNDESAPAFRAAHVQWCHAAGEAEALELHLRQYGDDCRWLYADGLTQALKILEETEDGQFEHFDFLEISACTGGCLGGPLTVTPAPAAASVLRRGAQGCAGKLAVPGTEPGAQAAQPAQPAPLTDTQPKLSDLLFTEPIIPRPSRLLDTDFAAARKKMQQMEEIVTQLGGLDCGSCGAPNCRALAEDIVRKNAVKEDCVIVLKAQYEQMLFGKKPQ